MSELLPHCQNLSDIDEKYEDLSVSSEKLVGSVLDMAFAEGRAGEALKLIRRAQCSHCTPFINHTIITSAHYSIEKHRRFLPI